MDFPDDKTIMTELYNGANMLPGLFYGKTGLGMVLWLLGRLSEDDFFRRNIQEIVKISDDVTFEEGITGVGVMLNYLYLRRHKRQLSGILTEIDSRVYKRMAYNADVDIASLYGSTLYLCHRLKCDTALPATLREIFETQVMAQTECLIQRFLERQDSDYRFSMKHQPSMFVYAISAVMSCVREKDSLKKKIERILPKLLEIFPYSVGNRLAYWLALYKLSNNFGENKEIQEHLCTLQDSISEQRLLDCAYGNIYLGEGACGIYNLLRLCPKFRSGIVKYSYEIEDYIASTNELEHLRDANYLERHIGLWNGVAGLELTRLLIKSDRFTYGGRNGK